MHPVVPINGSRTVVVVPLSLLRRPATSNVGLIPIRRIGFLDEAIPTITAQRDGIRSLIATPLSLLRRPVVDNAGLIPVLGAVVIEVKVEAPTLTSGGRGLLDPLSNNAVHIHVSFTVALGPWHGGQKRKKTVQAIVQ